jgi:hypothetical protein
MPINYVLGGDREDRPGRPGVSGAQSADDLAILFGGVSPEADNLPECVPLDLTPDEDGYVRMPDIKSLPPRKK